MKEILLLLSIYAKEQLCSHKVGKFGKAFWIQKRDLRKLGTLNQPRFQVLSPLRTRLVPFCSCTCKELASYVSHFYTC